MLEIHVNLNGATMAPGTNLKNIKRISETLESHLFNAPCLLCITDEPEPC